MKDGIIQTLTWTESITFKDKNVRSNFDSQARSLHKYIDGNGEEKIGGYFRHGGNFTLVVTPKAGHMVAASRVYASKAYVHDQVHYGHLYCEGKGKVCDTFALPMCDYMNDCTGHGKCDESTKGQCVCNSGWFGADCSVKLSSLTN